jgi:threonine dehydratase
MIDGRICHHFKILLVAASGGNHGLAVAYAGKQFGMKTIVIVFEATAQYRIDLIRAVGAGVIRYGRTMDDLNAKVSEYTMDDHYVFIHPFSDDEVIAGQATIAHELLHQESDIDAIVVSIGGGGLISGISQYAKSFNPQIKIYGVETEGAGSMYQSLNAGKLVALPAITSIAASLGATKVTEKTFSIVRNYVDKVVTVTDAEAVYALKDILTHEKLLVEPASSCSLAAVLFRKLPELANKKVAVILCGGSFSLEELKQYL